MNQETEKDKITIGLFVDTFYPMIDGVITVVDNYARIMSEYANVIVFAPKTSKKKFDDSIFPYRVIRSKSLEIPMKDYPYPIPKLDVKFLKEVEKIDLDIVHIHSPASIGKVGIEYAKRHHKVLCGTIHSQYKQDFLRITKNKVLANMCTHYIMNLYKQCDVCYTVGEGMAKVINEEYHFPKKLRIMRNATSMELISDKKSARERINQKHNLTDKDYVFLYVGRINKLKNIFFILQALNKLENKINYKMLFVGSGEDEITFKREIKKLSLQDKVILCGRVENKEELRDYYARGDLFLFPSLYDTSSIVQVEAASQKCPTLFIKGSVTASAIKDNETGFLSENTEEAYAQRIVEIIKDKKLYQKVSETAYKELYRNWNNEVKQVYNTYLELLGKKE